MRLESFRCYLQARWTSARARTAEIGVFRALQRAGAHAGWFLVGLLLFPVALVLHLMGFRCLSFITTRIGHLAAEPDCFLKARALGELPKRRWFFLAPRGEVANDPLASYWADRIPAVRHPLLCRAVAGMTSLGLMRQDTRRYVMAYDRAAQIYRIQNAWTGRPPVLSITPDDAAWGRESLRALGVPAGAWFVGVHCREAGFAVHDDAVQRYRYSDVRSRLPALREIVSLGGWCLRMGGPASPPLPEIPGVIDYAHHPLRSARLDVVLCAMARFFLGDSSGLALVASTFGTPSLLVNMVPLSGLGPLPTDLNLPKLYRDRTDGRLLRFDEVLGTPAASYRFAAQYDRAGIDLVENSPEEIREATLEFLDQLDGKALPDAEGERLQATFASLLGPNDYGFGATSRVSASFLRRHRDLLPPEDVVPLGSTGRDGARR